MTHRRLPLPMGLVVGAILALAPSTPAGASPGDPDLCSSFGEVVEAGTLGRTDLVEASGLVASRAHPGVLWAHNDSGDTARLFALDPTGRDLGAYVVEGVEALDWEDIAIGPGPEAGRSYLYIGDIGDNAAARTDGVVVHRVAEPDGAPDGTGGTLSGAEAIRLRYPDGPADAEALLVDPVTGDLVVVTKDLGGESHVLRVAATDLVAGATVTPADEGILRVVPPPVLAGLPGTMVTAADVAPDGSFVLVRAYQSVLAFDRSPEQSLAEALLGTPCDAPSASEPQGEAIAVLADGTGYVTVSEAGPEGTAPPVHRVSIAAPAAPATSEADTTTASADPAPTSVDAVPATPPTDASSGATATSRPEIGSDGGGTSPWLVAAGVGIVVIAGVVLVAPMRRR